MHRVRLLLSMLCWGICAGAVAQTQQSIVTIDVVVLDAKGQPVVNLTRDSFVVVENGAVCDIRGFQPVNTPWDLVLLLDRAALPPARPSSDRFTKAVLGFLTDLKAQDRVAVAAFMDRAQGLMDWQTAQAALKRNTKFDSNFAFARGEKDVSGAIEWSLTKLRDAKGRKAVILLSDGHDGRLAPDRLRDSDGKEVLDPLFGLTDLGEADEFSHLIATVHASGARIFIVPVRTLQLASTMQPFPGGFMRPVLDVALVKNLEHVYSRMVRLAEVSRGDILRPVNAEDAIDGLYDLKETLFLDSRYTIQYAVNGNPLDLPNIEVRVRGENLRAVLQPPKR